MALAAAAEQVGWTVERLKVRHPDLVEELLEAQQDYELHASNMAKSLNKGPAFKLDAAERFEDMTIEDAMMSLPTLTPKQLANATKAFEEGLELREKLEGLLTVHDVDEIDLGKFPGDIFQPEPNT